MRFTGETLSWERRGDVCEVRFHREPCNEIGTTTLSELERLAEHVTAGLGGARTLLWYSDRRAGFCAGADLRELHAGLLERARRSVARRALSRVAGDDVANRAARRVGAPLVRREIRAFIDRIHGVFDAIDLAPCVTVAAAHGVVFGGGFELLLLADVVVADKSARFGFPELRLGLVPGFGGLPRLSRDVGNGIVRDLLFTGRTINATKAQEIGLVSQVVPRGEALDAARRVAQQAAKFDPAVVRAAKPFAKPHPKAELEREKELFCRLATSDAVLKALDTFVNSKDSRPYLP